MIAVGEHVRHLALGDQARQALGNRGLADAGFAHVERIVLAAATQDLDGALDLERAADQWIDAAGLRLGIEVGRVALQRTAASGLALAFALALRAAALLRLRTWRRRRAPGRAR